MISFSEMLKGKQHKVDKNKNGKLDAHDFKLLRKEEQELEEAVGKVETKKYSWGTMKTVHHGSEFSVPMHPEHHKAIAKLKDNQEHKFRDETGRDWTAKRMGDNVHIHGANNGGKTVVKHSDLKEEHDLEEAAPFKTKEDAVKYAKEKVKTHRDKLDGIEIHAHSGGFDVNHTSNSSGRNSLKKIGAKHVGTVYKEDLDEKFISGREYASQGVMHPDHAKMDIHKVTGQSVDFYASKTGDKMHGVVKKNDGKEVHIQAHKGVGDGKLHKFKVTPNLPKPVTEGLDEATPNKQQVKQAIGIARDKRYAGGNMTGAVRAMNKLNKGLAQHPAVKKELQKQNEEVEELDELSKGTLASYAKKATHDARIKHGIGKDFERISNSSRKPEYKQGAKEWETKYKSDARKREAGVGKAIDRLAKEEFELDEVLDSPGKFMSYTTKAAASGLKSAVMGTGKFRKRQAGIQRAVNKTKAKINNEEVAKATGSLKSACWKGYTAVGMKKKNGKMVPNCVPVKEELDEKMNMAKADMGDVIKDFQKSDAPQFAGKSKEKRREMAIAAKLQADRMKKEGVEMKSYRQFMEELYDKLPQQEGADVEVNEEVEQIDELDMNLLKSMQKHAKDNPRPKSSSDDAIDPKTGRLKPYGYRGKSEYEKSETGDDDEPKKRGRKAGITIGTYKRRQPK